MNFNWVIDLNCYLNLIFFRCLVWIEICRIITGNPEGSFNKGNRINYLLFS